MGPELAEPEAQAGRGQLWAACGLPAAPSACTPVGCLPRLRSPTKEPRAPLLLAADLYAVTEIQSMTWKCPDSPGTCQGFLPAGRSLGIPQGPHAPWHAVACKVNHLCPAGWIICHPCAWQMHQTMQGTP